MLFRSGLVGVENVVIATKGLQNRNINIIAGTTVKNKGKKKNSFPLNNFIIVKKRNYVLKFM